MEPGPDPMDRIEFIGAQGAGKSTVFRHLLRQRSPRDRWLTPGEARIRIAQRLRRRDLPTPWRRGVCRALRWNLLPLKREAVAGWLLQPSAPAVFDGLPPWARALMDLQLACLAGNGPAASAAAPPRESDVPWIATGDGLLKAKAISYSLEALLEMATLEFFRLDAPVVYADGGLLANQLGLSAAALEELTQGDRRHPLLPRGVVHCRLAADELIRRRKERIARGQGQFTERTLPDDALRASCRSMSRQVEHKAEILRTFGVPVLALAMADDPETNARQARAFIRDLSA